MEDGWVPATKRNTPVKSGRVGSGHVSSGSTKIKPDVVFYVVMVVRARARSRGRPKTKHDATFSLLVVLS